MDSLPLILVTLVIGSALKQPPPDRHDHLTHDDDDDGYVDYDVNDDDGDDVDGNDNDDDGDSDDDDNVGGRCL